MEGFETRGESGPDLRFKAVAREPLGPEPKRLLEEDTVETKGKDGTVYRLYMGYGNAEILVPGHEFPTTRTDRRHLYSDEIDSPKNLYIGRVVDGKLVATLFFRDVGTMFLASHLAVDAGGRCHVSVADTNMGSFKLYALVGDVGSGKWLDAVLVDQASTMTRYGTSRCVSVGDHLLTIWLRELGKDKGRGLFAVERTAEGFGKNVQLAKAGIEYLDAAVDPGTERVLVAYEAAEGIFLLSRASNNAAWEGPTKLDPALPTNIESYMRGGVWVRPQGKESFVVRAKYDRLREWEVSIQLK